MSDKIISLLIIWVIYIRSMIHYLIYSLHDILTYIDIQIERRLFMKKDQKISVRVTEEQLNSIDNFAAQKNMSRSQFIVANAIKNEAQEDVRPTIIRNLLELINELNEVRQLLKTYEFSNIDERIDIICQLISR